MPASAAQSYLHRTLACMIHSTCASKLISFNLFTPIAAGCEYFTPPRRLQYAKALTVLPVLAGPWARCGDDLLCEVGTTLNRLLSEIFGAQYHLLFWLVALQLEVSAGLWARLSA
jgi:hypothetical protein